MSEGKFTTFFQENLPRTLFRKSHAVTHEIVLG